MICKYKNFSGFRRCILSIKSSLFSHLLNSIPVLIPDFDNPFPVTGTGMENCIPKFWEREWERKLHSQLLGMRMGMNKSFPIFGNGNRRPVFPGMVRNGNSRSPLIQRFKRKVDHPLHSARLLRAVSDFSSKNV